MQVFRPYLCPFGSVREQRWQTHSKCGVFSLWNLRNAPVLQQLTLLLLLQDAGTSVQEIWSGFTKSPYWLPSLWDNSTNLNQRRVVFISKNVHIFLRIKGCTAHTNTSLPKQLMDIWHWHLKHTCAPTGEFLPLCQHRTCSSHQTVGDKHWTVERPAAVQVNV